jgi:carbon storage regulator CsrA
MLVLSRKSNESIVIGDNIRITIASVRGRYVRVGIEAPPAVKILREEICTDPETVPRPEGAGLERRVLANGSC